MVDFSHPCFEDSLQVTVLLVAVPHQRAALQKAEGCGMWDSYDVYVLHVILEKIDSGNLWKFP